MLKKLPLAILAASTVTATMAADNFSKDNAVDAVVIQDNVWSNPAALNNTPNQVSAASTNGTYATGGVVFEYAGQKMGLHVGNQVDFASPLYDLDAEDAVGGDIDGFNFDAEGISVAKGLLADNDNEAPPQNGSIDYFIASSWGGIRLGYTTYSISGLSAIELGFLGDTIPYTETEHNFAASPNNFSAVVAQNEAAFSASEVNATFGSINNRGGYSFTFSLPSFNGSDNLEYQGKTTNGSTSTTYDYDKEVYAKSNFSFAVDGGFKQFLSRSFFLSGSASYARLNSSSRSFERSVTTSGSNPGFVEETIENKLDLVSSTIRAAGGIGGVVRKGPSTFRYTQDAEWILAGVTGTVYDDQTTTGAGSTTVTGKETDVLATVNSSVHIVNLPFAASAEVAAGEKWTWRAGIEANLASITFGKVTATPTKPEGGSRVDDFTSTVAKPSGIKVLPESLASFGIGYKPVSDFEINAQLESSWSDIFGRVSASYSF
ncbi:hypothetical protein [Salinibius halmophilus]|uniref:hypothetical protein n=1 Tax=Salinibius halmophilus TaxID=1853216 RepID=UPI000E674023|nr:hypothetical protein [Salinibius halmophilus]